MCTYTMTRVDQGSTLVMVQISIQELDNRFDNKTQGVKLYALLPMSMRSKGL